MQIRVGWSHTVTVTIGALKFTRKCKTLSNSHHVGFFYAIYGPHMTFHGLILWTAPLTFQESMSHCPVRLPEGTCPFDCRNKCIHRYVHIYIHYIYIYIIYIHYIYIIHIYIYIYIIYIHYIYIYIIYICAFICIYNIYNIYNVYIYINGDGHARGNIVR